MKSIKLLMFAAGILLMGFLSGCESDEKDYPVTISFSNATALDSVFDGDTYTLKGTIIADGPIKTVQFYRNYPLTYTLDSVKVTKQDSVEIAGTMITDIKSDTCNFSISVPDITYQTTVRVVATQNNGHKISSVYTINSGRITNLNSYLNLWAGGWNAPNYGNFFSIEQTIPASYWGYSSETSHRERLPQCEFYFGDYKVGATDLDSLKHSSQVPGFSDLGTRFAKTTFTTAQFDAIRADDDFKSMSPTLTYVDFGDGDVILFKTKAGKLGLLKIISTDGLENFNFSIIIQK